MVLIKKKMAKTKIKLSVLGLDGKKGKEIELPETIFGAKVNTVLIAQAIRVYLSNQRTAKASTKTRSEVRGSGKKIWRQKGTGRARHGDKYAPIFVGGGIAHGPKGDQNFKAKLTKKMKKAALFGALTGKLQDKEVLVVNGLKGVKPKTKEAVKILNKGLGVLNKKCLIILPESWENTLRSFRNIPLVKLTSFDKLNTYSILNHNQLIFAQETIEKLNKEAKK